MTIWGARASMEISPGSIMAVRKAKVGEFRGRSLDIGESGSLEINPDDARAFALQRWFQEHGNEPVGLALTQGMGGQKRTLEECRQEDMSLALAMGQGGFGTQGLGGGDAAGKERHRHRVLATITSIPHDKAPFYLACTAEVTGANGQPRSCNRRVQQGFCSANHECPQPLPRYVLRVQIADATGYSYASVFGEDGTPIMGMQAPDLYRLWERMNEGDTEAGHAYEQAFVEACNRPWDMMLSSRKEEWEGKQRVKMCLNQSAPINYASEGRAMLSEIKLSLGSQAGAFGGRGSSW